MFYKIKNTFKIVLQHFLMQLILLKTVFYLKIIFILKMKQKTWEKFRKPEKNLWQPCKT